MPVFKIYHEIGGHKMKTEIIAKDDLDAKQKLRNKIEIHKCEKVDPKMTKDSFDEAIDMMSKIFGKK